MNVVLWVVQALLAILFAGAGAAKLARSKPALVDTGMSWAEDRSETQIKAIGLVEVLGAIGLLVPAAVGVVPILTPIAAAGFAVAMALAARVHARRGESPGPPLVLCVIALVVAVLRFGPYAP